MLVGGPSVLQRTVGLVFDSVCCLLVALATGMLPAAWLSTSGRRMRTPWHAFFELAVSAGVVGRRCLRGFCLLHACEVAMAPFYL